MTAAVTEVQWNGEGQPPLYDSDHLKARITAITDPDAIAQLQEAWVANGLGQLEPLMTADDYVAAERLIANGERSVTGPDQWHRLNAVADALYALPEHIYRNACEALRVYAGVNDPRAITVSTLPRIAECERIIAEAVAYAAELEANPIPSVDDLPPVDDTQEQVASEHYPGTKAGVPIVKAWVDAGADETAQLNRAARAYAQEQDRATPRKGLTSWLEARLGPERLATVKATLEANAVPPMDLAGGPSAGDGGTASPTVDEPVEPSPDAPSAASADEAEPAVSPAPYLAPAAEREATALAADFALNPYAGRREPIDRIVLLHRQLADAYADLAEVI